LTPEKFDCAGNANRFARDGSAFASSASVAGTPMRSSGIVSGA